MTIKSLYWENVRDGEELPTLIKEVTATTIVYGALASRDFMPVHHDTAFAQKQGMKDIFMNALTTGGWAGRYLTDWTGPEGETKRVSFRIGVPCFPGDTFTWTGKVTRKYLEGDHYLVDVEFNAAVEAGSHCSGTATLALPNTAS
ncbi:MaoC/PaaZ C-terminal domain-containing protein [Chloroflexota bacterium]